MYNDNPLAHSLVALNLALPGLWLFGRALARRAAGTRAAVAVVAPALGLAAWLMSVHACAYFSHRFSVGLVVGTLAPSLAGVSLAWRDRRGGAAPPSGSISRAMLVSGAALALLVVLPLGLSGMWHDETLATGNLSLVPHMQNGHYPPRFLPLVHHELRWHYGFSALCAMATALWRLPAPLTLDLVTTALWMLAWCNLWVLGEQLFGRARSGAVTAVCVLFAGGVAPALVWHFREPWQIVASSYLTIRGQWINAPVLSFFFQHPWSLGIPLFASFLVLYTARTASPERRLFEQLALGLLLLALSLSQIVVFFTLAASSVVGAVFDTPPSGAAPEERPGARRRIRWSNGAPMALTAAAAWLLARQLGGFFAPSHVDNGGLALGSSFSASWALVSFGALPLLGLAGLALVPRARALLGLLALGGMGIVASMHYAFSHDVVKFATASTLALAVGVASLASRLLQPPATAPRVALAAALVASTTCASFSFAEVVLAGQAVPYFYAGLPPLAPDDEAALGFLRRRVRFDEVVYRAEGVRKLYSRWGGLAVAETTQQVMAFGYSDADQGRYDALQGAFAADPRAYLAAGVRWFVIDRAREPQHARAARAWVAQGQAEAVARFGALDVYRLR